MNALQVVKSILVPGNVYRRADLEQWSNAIDRHLGQLQKEKALFKLSGGLYYCPKQTGFGVTPPNDYDLVEAFLKDHRFLLMTPNMYNALGLGTTQLYNETVIYNHRRHGTFKLGGRPFRFIMKHYFPLELSNEYLLINLVDNLNKLAEDREKVLKLAKEKAMTMNRSSFMETLKNYGGAKARKFFLPLLENHS